MHHEDEVIHKETVENAKAFHSSEKYLLNSLEKVDDRKIWRHFGHASLFEYCMRTLKLSEGNACGFITVMRKAKEVPALKKALEEGTLTVSSSKRITRIINGENAEVWIEKAKELPQRELEKVVAEEFPQEVVREKLRVVGGNRTEFRCGISGELETKVRRAQDLLSQRLKRPASLEETLADVLGVYLERRDPVEKAKRNVERPQRAHSLRSVRRIPQLVKNRVLIRDKGRCQFSTSSGVCGSGRWVNIHHRRPFCEGGEHVLENLVTLCSSHHRSLHQVSRK